MKSIVVQPNEITHIGRVDLHSHRVLHCELPILRVPSAKKLKHLKRLCWCWRCVASHVEQNSSYDFARLWVWEFQAQT